MTEQKLVSKAEFSRIVGVSESRVSRMSKSNLAEAMVGKRIDMAHASVKLYITKRRAKELKDAESDVAAAEEAAAIAPPAQKQRKTRKKANPEQSPEPTPRRKRRKDLISDGFMQPPDDDELGKFGNMKLKDIIKRYGTMTQFKDLLSATKLIEDILEKRIKNAKASGDLISREHVHTFVFGAIEAINIRLIQDSPRTIAARILTALESGETAEQVEVIIRELISSQIRSMKKEVTKGMKSA